MPNELLASAAWIADLAFFLILILGTALGARRGFVGGICKLAGTLFATIFAFAFCVSFANVLESWFGLTTAITNGMANSIASGSEVYGAGLASDVAGAEISSALETMGVGGFQRWLISKSFASVEVIPAGTTPAMLISSVLTKWIVVVIAFLSLLLLIKLSAWLITKIFDAIKDKVAPIKVIDQVLGAMLGFVKAGIGIFLLLLICNWLPIQAIHAYIESSTIVGKIFVSEWFRNATNYAISGAWFNDYIKQLLP